MVRGKFKCSSITHMDNCESRKIVFHAVCDDGTPENQQFSKYTPSGTIEILINGPALAAFELGKAYYFDASPVPAAPGDQPIGPPPSIPA